jgi:alpha-galactosidase
VSEIGFSQDPWTPFGGPGHFNDPDMLVIGWVGWGPDLHSTRLTADEQYSHITLWCMLASPLLIGCDMDRLDPFTLNLLTNDEVLAINQDALGRQGRRVKAQGPIDIYRKDLEDGGAALALFNRGGAPHTIHLKLDRIGFNGKLKVRDLWRQKDLGVFKIEGYPTQDFTVTIAPHSAELFKVSQ